MPQEHVTGSVVTVTDETFAETVLASHQPVLVDFWAPWCPPCTVVSRTLAELAGEFGDWLLLTKINTDENPVTTRAYGVMSMPTPLVVHDGEVVGSLVGARPKSLLRQFLSERI